MHRCQHTMTGNARSDAGKPWNSSPPVGGASAHAAPRPGEALVRVAACGFCHHDRLVMSGVLRRGVRPGVVLGHEIAGVVEEVGNDVDHSTPRRPGGVAAHQRLRPLRPLQRMGTRASLPQRRGHRPRAQRRIRRVRGTVSQHSLVYRCPMRWSLHLRRCWPALPGVALQALSAVEVSAGETVVVTGAGGGLGVHAVQLAAALGARTLAVTSSPHKAQTIAELRGRRGHRGGRTGLRRDSHGPNRPTRAPMW